MPRTVAVLLYPGCIFFEIALAAEVLQQHLEVEYYTPDGALHFASNGAHIAARGSYLELACATPIGVLIPGGDPESILAPESGARDALVAQANRGALLAGICAGSLVLAASGLLRGRRGTHNYTAEYAPPEVVAATAALWEGMKFVRSDLVQDDRMITAQPWAYRQYAATVARELDVLSEAEAKDLVSYVQRRTYGDA